MTDSSDHILDPRVVVDTYIVRPTGYDDMVFNDKDAWCLTVTNGHAWGWSIRRGISAGSSMAMNRKGEWIVESRGSGHNKSRRWPLDEALSIALGHIDSIRIMGRTAREASDFVAKDMPHGG
jgi:hypothetical protein